MENDPTSPAGYSSLQAIIAAMERQWDRENDEFRGKCRESWLAERHLTLPELRALGSKGPYAREILKAHPFYDVEEAIEHIEVAFGILDEAYETIVRHYGAFHASLLYHGRPDYIAEAVTQRLFQFVFAASSLIQAYRRLLSLAPQCSAPFAKARFRIFDDPGLSAFVQMLRNCYGHQAIISVSPMGAIKLGKERGVQSSIEFDKSQLLSLRQAWNAEARTFIEKSNRLDVMCVLSEYHKRAKNLKAVYLSETGIIHSFGFRELARCREAILAMSHIAYLGIFLQGERIRSTDPYSHLPQYFSKEEVKRIMCFPVNSREQVDFMISLRDPLCLCDEDTRGRLYEMFEC